MASVRWYNGGEAGHEAMPVVKKDRQRYARSAVAANRSMLLPSRAVLLRVRAAYVIQRAKKCVCFSYVVTRAHALGERGEWERDRRDGGEWRYSNMRSGARGVAEEVSIERVKTQREVRAPPRGACALARGYTKNSAKRLEMSAIGARCSAPCYIARCTAAALLRVNRSPAPARSRSDALSAEEGDSPHRELLPGHR